jgi:hypothetical protein
MQYNYVFVKTEQLAVFSTCLLIYKHALPNYLGIPDFFFFHMFRYGEVKYM